MSFAGATGWIVAAVGFTTLVGWWLKIELLKTIVPGYVSMKANTAMAFLLSGIAIALLSSKRAGKPERFLATLLASIVSAVGVLTLSEYLCGWNLGIDQWLFLDAPFTVGTLQPGRMSPTTAFCFVMLGAGLLFSCEAVPSAIRRPMQAAIGSAVIVVGVLAFCCYFIDASMRTGWWSYAGMSFHSAAAFVLLGIALLSLVRSEGGTPWALNKGITIGFIVVVGMMLVTSIASYSFTHRLVATGVWVSRTQEVLKKIQDVASHMGEFESSQRSYVFTGNKALLDERTKAGADVQKLVAELREMIAGDPSQQRYLDELEILIASRARLGDQAISVRMEEGLSPAVEMIATGASIKLTEHVRALFREMRSEEYAVLAERQRESDQAVTGTFLLLPLGVFFSLTVLFVGFFFLNAGMDERARATSALKRSEARLAGIVTSAMNAIISTDEAQRIVLFNSAAEKMFGRTAAEVIGQSLDLLSPPRTCGAELESKAAGDHGTILHPMRSFEPLRCVRANGEEFPTEASVSEAEVEGEKTFTIILRDITDRKRAEESAALLAAIVESSSDAIVGKDLNGVVTSWNAGAAKLFGFEASEMVGQPILRIIPPGYKGDEEKILSQIRRGERVEHFETVRLRKDGSLIDVSIAVSPIRNAAGKIFGASKVARDITERKRADQERQKLAQLIEHSEDFIGMSDLEGRITFMNSGARKMIGLSADRDLSSVHFTDYVPPESYGFFRDTIFSAALEHGQWQGEMQFRNMETGELVDVFRTTFLLRDANGQPSAFATVTRDITEQKRAGKALRESEERLHAVTENLTEGLIICGLDGQMIHWNRACLKMHGYRNLEEALHKLPDFAKDYDLRTLDGRPLSLDKWPLARVLRGECLRDMEVRVRRKELEWERMLSYSGAIIHDANGKPLAYLAISDVTDRRLAEAALGQSEARYRTLFDYAPDGILIADPQSNYLDANRSICGMLGYEREDLIGLKSADITVPMESGSKEQTLNVIGSRITYQREWQFRRKDGSVFPAEVIATVMPDGNLLGMVRDITERKRSDATLREAEKEKQLAFEASRLKSEFLANMSHELRTPLNCIIGFTEFLVDEKPGPLNAKQKEYLTDVYNSSNHLLQLINDVLDLAKVEAGKLELHLEAFPLAKAIEDVCAVVKGIAQKKGVKIQWSVAPEVRSVTLDQQKFKQVCFNLLSNAVKFTDISGSVIIDAQALEGERFEVRVKDNGIGIKQEDLNRLFREFEQLDSGADRRFQGTGLGLALTKKLVESQGGSIGVESEYGKGSTFFAIMPNIVVEAEA